MIQTFDPNTSECASCGGDENLHRDILHGILLCIHCEGLDTFYGYPVLKNEPTECPFCHGRVDTKLMPEDCATDNTLTPYFGDDYESRSLTHYIYDCAQCENWECPTDRSYFPYGRRWYWNPESGDYDAEKPLVGTDVIRAFNQAQEAAGQKRLPGFDQ